MADEPTQVADVASIKFEAATTYESNGLDVSHLYIEVLRSTMTQAADTPDALAPVLSIVRYREFPSNPFV